MNPDEATASRTPATPGGMSSLTLTVRPFLVPRFFRILQRGFTLRTLLGRSVAEVLCSELGLTEEFLDAKVQTLFLNGKAIDDPHTAMVPDGAVIALSSAMPGLVGATLRRGSTYAAMRSQITYDQAESAPSQAEGTITLKLYNLLLDELGKTVLENGITIGRDLLADFLKDREEDFRTGCLSAALDGAPVEPARIAQTLSGHGARVYQMVRLTVISCE
ncbi:MAG: hypothetical protein ABFD98_18845 [Syntrophobacteraceae bacterium]|nr:hypothetical protein [Desulfobacteraceae bacterium]